MNYIDRGDRSSEATVIGSLDRQAMIADLLMQGQAHMLRDCKSSKGGLPTWKMKKINNYIAQNLAGKVLSQHLADTCGLSVSHFHRAFQASFGCSPHRYVMKMRLAAARTLLIETDWPIKFIALECGMSDQAHLTRVMRTHCATTPMAVRRRGQGRVAAVRKNNDAGSRPMALAEALI